MSELVVVDKAEGIATVTLNRPDAMNALSRALRADFADAMYRLDRDGEVRVVILTGAGDRAFTAGLDLKELGSDPLALPVAGASDPRQNPVAAIALCGKPVIAAINGVAITGGFELALACDILIASSRARFADTHARVGIVPGWGLSQKLSRLIGPYRAKELSFSGNFLDAATAERWGLVNRVVEAAELLPAARSLARDIAGVDAQFLRGYKKLIDDGYAQDLASGLEIELSHWVDNAAVTPDQVEARRAAVQQRGRTQ